MKITNAMLSFVLTVLFSTVWTAINLLFWEPILGIYGAWILIILVWIAVIHVRHVRRREAGDKS